MKTIIKNLLQGLSMACTVYCFLGIFFQRGTLQQQLIGLIIFGLGAGLLSSVYLITSLSPLLQLISHYGGSLGLFLIINQYTQIVVFNQLSLLVFLLIFSLIFWLIWLSYYYYLNKQFQELNHQLAQRSKK